MEKYQSAATIRCLKRIEKIRVFFAISLIATVGLLWKTGIIRRVTNEILYRLPNAVMGFPSCPDCNVLLVSLDTLRADEMACYGYLRDTTPNLCRFAQENALFRQFYSNSSYTLDSHMSIFTGLYPSAHHMLVALKDNLSLKIPVLGEVLKDHGYRTAWVGITSDVNLPLNKGFGRGFDEIHNLESEDPKWEEKYQTILFPLLKEGSPKFIFFHTYAPHSPYLPGFGPYRFIQQRLPHIPVTNEEFEVGTLEFYRYAITEYTKRLKESLTKESIARNSSVIRALTVALEKGNLDDARAVLQSMPRYENYDLYLGWYWQNVNKYDPREVAYIQDLYDERLYQLDQQLLPLLRFLNRPEIKKKTIVLFFSDHGEEIMEHGEFDHGKNIYNIATHAPFILAAPHVKSGAYSELIQGVDIYPTILDLLGIRKPAPVEGFSLRSILEGSGAKYIGQRYLVSEHRGDNIVSIRNDRWKMYKNNTPEAQFVELYDLLLDPSEQVNILGEHPDIAANLDRVLTRMLNASPIYASVSAEFPAWLDQEKRRKLTQEGYF